VERHRVMRFQVLVPASPLRITRTRLNTIESSRGRCLADANEPGCIELQDLSADRYILSGALTPSSPSV
jgi:hypothetical protein